MDIKSESIFTTWGWDHDIFLPSSPTLRYQSFLCFLLPLLFGSQVKSHWSTVSKTQAWRKNCLDYQSMTRIIHLSLVFGLVMQVQGRIYSAESPCRHRTCVFVCVLSTTEWWLCWSSSPWQAIAFLPPILAPQLTLFSLWEGIYPECVSLDTQIFLYIKKALKRETMEAEVQMPFRTCGQMAWGSLSLERENSLAADRQPGTQPYNIQLLAGILSCCKDTKSFSDPNRDRDLKNNKNTSKIY